MSERHALLAAWDEARRLSQDALLATVVRIEGSTYRRPGARLLLVGDGRRVGSVSGGCLEDEVARKAWWLTGDGPTVQRYSTREEDDGARFGSGCEGVVDVLLERLRGDGPPDAHLQLLADCHRQRRAGAAAVVIGVGGDGGPNDGGAASRARIGDRVLAGAGGAIERRCDDPGAAEAMVAGVESCLAARRSAQEERGGVVVFIEYIPPPRSIVVFGAGFDAMPVVRMASELGWHVTVADGRADRARRERFPLADQVAAVDPARPLESVDVPEGAACVLMTHSADQDRALLAALAPLPLSYLGILGPRRRTEQLLRELGEAGRSAERPPRLHSPVGLDLGSETPEEIALAIVAEIQASFAQRDGRPLRDRADGRIHTRA
ncbi:MAG TPA: XdhC family protein [Kofleriaceae bacterium]|nr:XdhC family protein [Kofleriaceae bacterium]